MDGLSITFGITAEPIDVTGDPCEGCGDTPWMAAFGVFVEINGKRGVAMMYLCETCKGAVDGDDQD